MPFPFTDLTGAKRRPAVIVGRIESDDLLLAIVTSQAVGLISPSSHPMLPSDPEFSATGLKVPSRIRLDKLVTLHRGLITRRLGRIGPHTMQALAGCIRYTFEL
ncbi:MAG: type II toxin-antitoxin system PemK/MazF family toxin [Chloroflexi bacterium]|nr:type II toxin-antitoxin system PemK/MazF family toxin [Chloroflexota bacterium]